MGDENLICVLTFQAQDELDSFAKQTFACSTKHQGMHWGGRSAVFMELWVSGGMVPSMVSPTKSGENGPGRNIAFNSKGKEDRLFWCQI